MLARVESLISSFSLMIDMTGTTTLGLDQGATGTTTTGLDQGATATALSIASECSSILHEMRLFQEQISKQLNDQAKIFSLLLNSVLQPRRSNTTKLADKRARRNALR